MRSGVLIRSTKKIRTGTIVLIIFAAAILSLFSLVGSLQAQSNNETDRVDSKIQAEIIDSVCNIINQIYVFPDVAQDMEKKVRKAYQQGDYKEIIERAEFASRLSDDMAEICQDGHFGIRYAPNMDPAQYLDRDSLSQEEQERIRNENLLRLRFNNFAFKKLEILPGNIGYMKFDNFNDAAFGGTTAIAAMNFLANVDALIIDLRENGGGSPSMIQLITSYFFDESIHLNSFYVRESDSYQQFWTQEYVQGKRLTDVDLYVLTSNYTFSGAEEFSYNLKNLKRAILIGETTGGGAHPVRSYAFADLKILVRVPYGRAINPISGTNWERVGVTPHIEVPADQALDVAREEALKKLAQKEDNHPVVQAILDWELEFVSAKNNPFILELSAMQEYVGDYNPRHVFIEEGELIYQRDDRPKYKMIPMSKDTFRLEGLDHFKMLFVRDDQGNITEIMGMYNNGGTDHSLKTD